MTDTDTSIIEEEVYFRNAARILDIIGADLIKDEMAGVLELVKNAYDADARVVHIRFFDLNKIATTSEEVPSSAEQPAAVPEEGSHNQEKKLPSPPGHIQIEDEGGTGMDKDVLKNYWMVPATFEKGKRKKSDGGRPLLGRKGVGRFASMRLGHKLLLETTPEGSRDLFTLEVDWSRFNTDEVFVHKVPIKLKTHPNSAEKAGRTSLTISRLRDIWDEKRLEALYRELRLLVPAAPPSNKEQDKLQKTRQSKDIEEARPSEIPFAIDFDLSNSGLEESIIRQFNPDVQSIEAPKIADYIVNATIQGNGYVTIKWIRKLYDEKDEQEVIKNWEFSRIQRRFRDEDTQDVFNLKETSSLPDSDEEVPELPCGPFSLSLAIWDGDKEVALSKAGLLNELGGKSVGIQSIRSTLRRLSGVSIYRDGFRVRPYGDTDQDWLMLDSRRVRDPSRRLGPNQLRGTVLISSDANPELIDRSSREGLKDNTAFIALRAVIIAILSVVEPVRDRFRERHGLGRPGPRSTQHLTEKRQKAIQNLRSTIDEADIEVGLKSTVANHIAKVEQTINAEHDRLQLQARAIQDVHALGLLARFIIHEGRNIESALNSALDLLEDDVDFAEKAIKLPEDWKPSDDFLVALKASRNADLELKRLMDELDPLTRPRRRRRPKLKMVEMIRRGLDLLQPQIKRAGIAVRFPTAQYEVLAWEADVLHIIHNLLHNAIYWVTQQSGPRIIEIKISEAKRSGKHMIVTEIQDTGPGVPPEEAKDIFELGVSGRGEYGMGLFIAREAAQRSHGGLELTTTAPEGANFRIYLQKG